MLYATGNNWNQVYHRLDTSLSNFDTWCIQNNMVLNVSKSKYLIIGSRHRMSRIDYSLKLNVRNISLEYVKNVCYLGVYFDSEMTLSPLVSHVTKVVSTKVKIRKYFTTRCPLAICKQTILPLFDYAVFFY